MRSLVKKTFKNNVKIHVWKMNIFRKKIMNQDKGRGRENVPKIRQGRKKRAEKKYTSSKVKGWSNTG
jgi:hypothetical protein